MNGSADDLRDYLLIKSPFPLEKTHYFLKIEFTLCTNILKTKLRCEVGIRQF